MAVPLTRIPAQPTLLLGRTTELDTIEQQLVRDHVRLLSLIGPAGVGKTRLALKARVQLANAFPGGVPLVDLAPVREPGRVLPTVAQALGLTDLGTRPLLERLQEYLHEQESLLVLDNFEQVLPAASEIAELLATISQLTILVTSRVPLRLRWEQILRVLPLPVPDPEVVLPVADLITIPSVALFVERAQAQRADFIPSEEQAPLLAQLARQLDGIPLAIELAAANMSTLPLAVIARRLDRRLQTLQWDAQDLPDRQRSLHAAIGWSYDLLPPSEQRLFRHLGVFVGRVSLDGIEAVMGERDEDQALDGLVSLAERSLVLPAPAEDDDPAPSFGMLESVRQFAAEQLERQGELDTARGAHAQYFLALAEQADPHLRQKGQAAWFLRLQSEHDNLRTALRWLLDHDEPEDALRLAGALGYFWWRCGYYAEGRQWLEEGLSTATDVAPHVRIRALLRAGLLLSGGQSLDRSRTLLHEARMLAQRHGDRAAVVRAIANLGVRALYAEEVTESQRLLEEALKGAEALQDGYQVAFTRAYLAFPPFVQGDLDKAVALASDAVSRFQALGDLITASIVQFNLAIALQLRGEPFRAVQALQDGLRVSGTLRNRWHLCRGIEATVMLVGEGASLERRARLLGAGDALVQATGTAPGVHALVTGPGVAELRERLEQEGLDAVYRQGKSLPLEETVTLALELLEEFSQTLTATETKPKERVPQNPLSVRELEVLRLVAEGLTSKQIGQQIFLSPKTVNYHLTSVFNKLGVDSRAQAVAVAARKGIL